MIKIYRYIIIMILIMLFPVALNFISIWEINVPVAADNDWIGFYGSYAGSIIGGLVAVYVAYLQINKQKNLVDSQMKEQKKQFEIQIQEQKKQFNEEIKMNLKLQADNNRSYITLQELNNVPFDLRGIQTKENSRIILTKDYEAFLREREPNDFKTSFFVLTHQGNPSVILNCYVKIEIYTDRDERDVIEIYIGTIDKSEGVYVPLYVESADKEVNVISVTITYLSLSGEEIRYNYDPVHLKESYSIIDGENIRTIFEFNIDPVTWIFPEKR